MLRVNKNANITIREIEFSIRIKDKDSSFTEILDILYDELTTIRNTGRYRRKVTENPVRDFIQANIERSILVRENTKVYFLNYKEKEGSIRITFTLLIVTNYKNYASLRQEIDVLVKDSIAAYFEEILERHLPVNITVQTADNEIITLSDSVNLTSKPQRNKSSLLTKIIAIAALVISIFLAGLYLFNLSTKNQQSEGLKLKENYIDSILEKKISDAVRDQKFTINLYKIADTLSSDRQTIEVPAPK